MKARRVVVLGVNEVEVREAELPAVGPEEILLEADCSLISAGTELAGIGGLTSGARAAAEERRPRQIGYSFVGTVKEVGQDVTAWRPGQRVVGQAPHASHAVVASSRPFVSVPEDVPAEHAAFAVLMAIALNAVRMAHVQIGEPVAVVGQGLVGQLAGQFARINGVRPLVVLDALDTRLQIAREGGATHTINVREHGIAGSTPGTTDSTSRSSEYGRQEDERLAEAVRAATGGEGPRVVIEATGAPRPVVTALRIAARGARVVLLGSTRGLVHEWDPYTDVHLKALTIIGAHSPSSHPPVGTFWSPFTVPENMRVGLELVRDGSLRLDRLITSRFPGSEASRAYAGLLERPDEHMGVILKWRT